MKAVGYRLMAELRARWRGWLGLSVLVGLLAGSALASAAGAHRTGTVVDRSLVATRPPNIYMIPAFSENGELLDFERIAAFPVVDDAIRAPLLFPMGDDLPDVSVYPQSAADASRHRVLAGRIPDPSDPTAAVLNVLARDEYGWDVGDSIEFTFAGIDSDPFSGEVEPGPTHTFRVAAVIADLSDLAGDAAPGVFLTEGFGRAHGGAIFSVDLFAFRVSDDPASFEGFHDGIARLTGDRGVFYIANSSLLDQVRRSFALQAGALWLLSAFLGVAAVLIGAQLLSRLTALESVDAATLRWLGLSRHELVGLGAARTGIVLLSGTIIALAAALAASPLFPFGRPALVEPTPGLSIDPRTLAVGAAVFVLAVLATTAIPTWRVARGSDPRRARPSVIAGFVGRLAPRPSTAIGVRLALEPGRGRTAVPVRSSLASAALGVGALVLALGIGASMNHLLASPDLYGWTWDVVVGGDGADLTVGGSDARSLAAVPGVDAFASGVGGEGGSVVIGDRTVAATAIDLSEGIAPPVIEGRLPASPNEVALGPKSLRAAGAQIGDGIETRFSGVGSAERFTVVGTVVLPFTSDTTALGEGALFSFEGGARMFPGLPRDAALVRFRPGADRDATIAALEDIFEEVDLPREPSTVLDFGRVRAMPLIAAGIVAVLAAGTIAHVLASAIRRRRRDLAVLAALGLRRGQIRSAVLWQAATSMVVALIIGIPAGVIGARWLWRWIAAENGFIAEPVADVSAMVLTAALALAIAGLIAALPARAAARTKPALVLRSE